MYTYMYIYIYLLYINVYHMCLIYSGEAEHYHSDIDNDIHNDFSFVIRIKDYVWG